MAFTIPQFNLVADLYKMFAGYDFTAKAFRVATPCQLRAYGSHPKLVSFGLTLYTELRSEWCLLCPAGTDVRDSSCTGLADVVEVPSGSGRWYAVAYVDDVAKGFANEYRVAMVVKVGPDDFPTANNFPYWPTPIP